MPKFYWLRQPLISIERLLQALEADTLINLLREESVMDAIRLASPGLDEYLGGGEMHSPKVGEALLKYCLRMGTRCTPFGLFAGASVGNIKASSEMDFRDRKLVPRHRLDMQVLIDLVHAYLQQPIIKEQSLFFTNQTAYQIGERIRYTERQWIDRQWHYFSSEVPAESPILIVLSNARYGATISDLVKSISGKEINLEAYAFVEQLIADNLLMSELMPSVTGPDTLSVLIQKLSNFSLPNTAYLEQIQNLLNQSAGNHQPAKSIKTILTDDIGLVPTGQNIFQTDTLVIGGTNQLSRKVIIQLQNSLSALHELSQFNTELNELNTFKHRFYKRYEGQEVPLLIALDEETGIGYGDVGRIHASPEEFIIDVLTRVPVETTALYLFDKLHDLRLRLYSDSVSTNNSQVEITDQDIAHLNKCVDSLPDNYYALGYFLASSVEAMDAGNFQFVLKTLTGPSAYSLMGRFCGVDSQLNDLVVQGLAHQQNQHPDAILAEIVHLPQARAGNVIHRPHLRAYEIPYLTPSTLPLDQQIQLDDLLISVPNGQRVVLRSRRLGKEVLPTLTTAHDYRDGLPIYRFLCDLNYQQNNFSVSWNWGGFLKARRLPRVIYKNIILKEASWNLTSSDLTQTFTDSENVLHLQQRQQLPRFIAIQQGDQELFLDLSTVMCRQLFVSTLRRMGEIQVIEWLRTPDNCPVHGKDGKLTHEVIIPFIKSNLSNFSLPFLSTPIQTLNLIKEVSYPPGSEWFYVKIFCGLLTAELVLSRLLNLAHITINKGQLTHWFFIRYAEPENHLRVRFRLREATYYFDFLAACQKSLLPMFISGEIHRFQLDTYRRELERYDYSTIEQTERIFWRNSELVTQVILMSPTESQLLTAALLVIDGYQTEFKLSQSEKTLMCEHIYLSLFAEHGSSMPLRQLLAKKYRRCQSLVERVLRHKFESNETLIHDLVQQHNVDIKTYITDVYNYFKDKEKHITHNYLNSLGHLFLNRLFKTNQRTFELVIYHHLFKANRSIQATC